MERIDLPGLTLTNDHIEMAYRNGDDIYVVRVVPDPDIDHDVNNRMFLSDVFLFVDDGNGAVDGEHELVAQMPTERFLVKSDAGDSLADAISKHVMTKMTSAASWATRLRSQADVASALAPSAGVKKAAIKPKLPPVPQAKPKVEVPVYVYQTPDSGNGQGQNPN